MSVLYCVRSNINRKDLTQIPKQSKVRNHYKTDMYGSFHSFAPVDLILLCYFLVGGTVVFSMSNQKRCFAFKVQIKFRSSDYPQGPTAFQEELIES